MKHLLKNACALTLLALATQAGAQAVFFEHDGFRGRSFSTEHQIRNLAREGFNDRASSVQILGGRWEVCEDARFRGRCMVLRPGRYPSLSSMGMNDRLSSVREVDRSARVADNRFAPVPDPFYDSLRRNGERLYEAPVTSVRAVVATPEQRCWVERERVGPNRGDSNNVPAAIAGALIGGILGHQVGGGSGRDIATAGGVVAGAVVGSRMGSDGQMGRMQDVQRCAVVPNQQPDYWDVTYTFRRQEHRIQMTEPPGAMVTVNRQGEPRNR